MAKQLKMAVVQMILTLKRLGWSQRRSAREFAIDRDTVGTSIAGRLVQNQPRTRSPGSGSVPAAIRKAEPATNPISGSEVAGLAAQKPDLRPESRCEPFRAVIEEKLGQGLAGQRIY
jgi:hypothetical protein